VNDAHELNDPRCLPSVKSLRPATPSRAPGSGFPRQLGLATALAGVDAFSPARTLSESVRARPPSTRPRCQRESRFSGPRPRLPTSATETTHGHTLRASDPRARVRLSPRCSPAPTDAGCVGSMMRCRTGNLRATTCTLRLAPPRSTCVDGANRGPKHSREGEPRALGRYRACPPRSAPSTRVTGANRREVWTSSRLLAPAETYLGRRPAKGNAVGKIEVPSTATKSLRDRRIAPPCTPGPRPRHAASVEALLEGSRAFFSVSATPASDEESVRTGSTDQTNGSRGPRRNSQSQRPSRLLRPNQLAGSWGVFLASGRMVRVSLICMMPLLLALIV
jgi:hypothetical protein